MWKAPQWGAEAPAQVVFSGYGQPIDPEQREAELTRYVGYMTARGWTQVHRMPGAVLLAQVQYADRKTAVGVGATGVAAGAVVGGAGIGGVLAGIGMIILGALLTLTIIGAIIGIPMIAAGVALLTGGTAAAAAPMAQSARPVWRSVSVASPPTIRRCVCRLGPMRRTGRENLPEGW